jgi:hypothetical protein
MPYVQSSALIRVSYDQATRTLSATFRDSGRTYAYRDVPQEIYAGLMEADSLGNYFNACIRDRFQFQELGKEDVPDSRH